MENFTAKYLSLSPGAQKVAAAFLIFLSFLAIVWGVYNFLPVHENANLPVTEGWAVDWKGCIRSDILKLLSGRSPYKEGCGLNPPWTYVLLAPVALLSPELGAAVMFALTYMVYIFVLLRMGAKPLAAIAIVGSSFVFINARNGNIDFLPVLGFVLPPQFALLFLAIKPQVGAGLAVFYMIEAYRKGGLSGFGKLIAPVTSMYLLSFVIFGLYPIKLIRMPDDPYNASLFPYSLIFGIPLLVYALRSRQKLLSISATPLLAPYINIHSFAILLFAFLPYQELFILVVALTWLF